MLGGTHQGASRLLVVCLDVMSRRHLVFGLVVLGNGCDSVWNWKQRGEEQPFRHDRDMEGIVAARGAAKSLLTDRFRFLFKLL